MNRDDIIGAVFAAFISIQLDEDSFPCKLEFLYAHESGMGNGVTRDVFHHFFTELAKHNLFTDALPTKTDEGLHCPACNGTCLYRSTDHYRILGQIIAKCLFDEIVVSPIYCSRAWVRFMMSKQLTLYDIENEELYTTMVRYRTEKQTIEEYQVQWGDVNPFLKDCIVTKETLDDYIQARIEHECFHSRLSALDAMKEGFTQFEPIRKCMRILNIQQLHTLCFGTPTCSKEEFKSLFSWHARINEQHITRIAFLKWIDDKTTETLRLRLLFWITAYSRIPIQDFNIYIHLLPRHALPTAQTCFRKLFLPNYEGWTIRNAVSDLHTKFNTCILQQRFLLR